MGAPAVRRKCNQKLPIYLSLRDNCSAIDSPGKWSCTGASSMSSVILFLVIMVLFGLVGSAYSYTRYGGFGLGGGLALVAIVIVLVWLAGGLGVMR